MKKFKFRLQKVLDYREADKRDKKRELGMRNKDLREAEEVYDSLIDAHDELADAHAAVLNMAELQALGAYQQRLVQCIEEQENKVREATMAVEQAREYYLRSAVDAGALNLVLERKKGEWTYEWKRSERKFANEVAIQRHNRRKGEL